MPKLSLGPGKKLQSKQGSSLVTANETFKLVTFCFNTKVKKKKVTCENARSIQRPPLRKRNGIIFQMQGYKKFLEVENIILRKTNMRLGEAASPGGAVDRLLPHSTLCFMLGNGDFKAWCEMPVDSVNGGGLSTAKHSTLETDCEFQYSVRICGEEEPPESFEICSWAPQGSLVGGRNCFRFGSAKKSSREEMEATREFL